MRTFRTALAVFQLLLFLAAIPAWAVSNAVTPGKFVVEPPTLLCAGFEWNMAGDDNRNAVVEVAYRKKGTTGWKQGLPLLRMGGEKSSTR